MKLFIIKVLMLKLLYKIKSLIIIKFKRINKIKVWLIQKEIINVRKFLKAIIIIK